MKKTAHLEELHIGSMIKEIALNKGVPSKVLAGLIRRYEQNADKIYRLEDMDTEDIILISYPLEYHFLKVISDKYLSHLPAIKNNPEQENYYLKWDGQSGNFTVLRDIGKDDILQKIHIGQHIRKFAEKKGWSQQDMAKILQCLQSSISDLYRHKSLKIKKLVHVSSVLKHNFIAEMYLSRMFLVSSSTKSTHYIMTKTPQEIRIENPDDKIFSMVFRRQDDKK